MCGVCPGGAEPKPSPCCLSRLAEPPSGRLQRLRRRRLLLRRWGRPSSSVKGSGQSLKRTYVRAVLEIIISHEFASLSGRSDGTVLPPKGHTLSTAVISPQPSHPYSGHDCSSAFDSTGNNNKSLFPSVNKSTRTPVRSNTFPSV